MTDIEAKALALLNEVARDKGVIQKFHVDRRLFVADEALCRAIEQHEAFKQEVSDAMVATSEFLEVCGCGPSHSERQRIASFIIPKPKPDPLVEVLGVLNGAWTPDAHAEAIRHALDALGFEIREKGQ